MEIKNHFNNDAKNYISSKFKKRVHPSDLLLKSTPSQGTKAKVTFDIL
jgi:hypothetical protein